MKEQDGTEGDGDAERGTWSSGKGHTGESRVC